MATATANPPLVNQKNLDANAQELFLRAEASKRASADPLPGPLVDAFGSHSISVDGVNIRNEVVHFEVRPLVAYDWAMFKRLNSPIYRMMLEIVQQGGQGNGAQPQVPAIEAQPEDDWELVYLLTRPCAEADAVFSKGRAAFAAEAKRTLSYDLHTGFIMNLVEACMAQVRSHFTTMVKYAPAKSNDEGGPMDFLSAASPS